MLAGLRRQRVNRVEVNGIIEDNLPEYNQRTGRPSKGGQSMRAKRYYAKNHLLILQKRKMKRYHTKVLQIISKYHYKSSLVKEELNKACSLYIHYSILESDITKKHILHALDIARDDGYLSFLNIEARNVLEQLSLELDYALDKDKAQLVLTNLASMHSGRICVLTTLWSAYLLLHHVENLEEVKSIMNDVEKIEMIKQSSLDYYELEYGHLTGEIDNEELVQAVEFKREESVEGKKRAVMEDEEKTELKPKKIRTQREAAKTLENSYHDKVKDNESDDASDLEMNIRKNEDGYKALEKIHEEVEEDDDGALGKFYEDEDEDNDVDVESINIKEERDFENEREELVSEKEETDKEKDEVANEEDDFEEDKADMDEESEEVVDGESEEDVADEETGEKSEYKDAEEDLSSKDTSENFEYDDVIQEEASESDINVKAEFEDDEEESADTDKVLVKSEYDDEYDDERGNLDNLNFKNNDSQEIVKLNMKAPKWKKRPRSHFRKRAQSLTRKRVKQRK